MVDVGLSQLIVQKLNRRYRRRAKPHGSVDHFHRGTCMSLTGAARIFPCCCSIMLLSVAVLLYFGPDFMSDKPHWEVLGIKIAWLGIVAVALLTPLEVFRECLIITDDGLLKINLFGRQTRMAWPDIASFQINPNDNKVIFLAGDKAKVKASLAYNGWQDFLETAAQRMKPELYAQFHFMFTNLDAKRPVIKPVKGVNPSVLAALITFTVATVAMAQEPASTATNSASKPAVREEMIPLIQFSDVPITAAIANLAAQAELNYLLAPQLMQTWIGSKEPSVSLKLKQVTARAALQRILENHNLIWLDDPASNIALIWAAGQTNQIAATILESDAESLHPATNLIPLIQFGDVPLTTAIEHLARQSAINYILAPDVNFGSGPGQQSEPLITLRLENVTTWHTLNRLLNVYGFTITPSPATRVVRISSGDSPASTLDPSLLNPQTNTPDANRVIPLLVFSDAPLDVVLGQFIRQAGYQIQLDPQLKDLQNDPLINIRWENMTARQAIIALCENYDLALSKDETTGAIQIGPKELKKHHHLKLR